jgi:hypothetical protein
MGYTQLIPIVTKMFQQLHPGKRYYLTNVYARGMKPSEVLAGLGRRGFRLLISQT